MTVPFILHNGKLRPREAKGLAPIQTEWEVDCSFPPVQSKDHPHSCASLPGLTAQARESPQVLVCWLDVGFGMASAVPQCWSWQKPEVEMLGRWAGLAAEWGGVVFRGRNWGP